MASKARDLSNFISVATIDASEIASGAITTDKIADVAVTHAKLHTDMNLSGKSLTFAADQISGNAIDGGVISNFTSTGIDDNATSTAVTILSNGNVGIGTSSPATTLDVNGTITAVGAITNNSGIVLQSSSVTKAALNVAASTNQGVLGTVAGDTYQWTTGGKILWSTNNGSTANLVIDSSGNVGIGTLSPDLKLDVTHNVTSEYVATFQNTADNLEIKIGTITGGLLNIQGANASNNAAYDMCLQAEGGNVGIGTSSPDELLHIHGATQSYIKLTDDDSGQGATDGALFAFDGSSATQYIWNYENGPTVFATNSTERMRISSSGNVGIGEILPQTKLHVKSGDSGGTVYDAGYNPLVIEGSSHTGLQILSPNNRNGVIYFGDNDNAVSGRIEYEHANDAFQFVTAGTERMRIDSVGRVTMPYQPAFSVYANTNETTGAGGIAPFNGIIFDQGNNYSTANRRFVAPVAGIYQFSTYTNANGVSAGSAMWFYFSVNGSSRGAYMYLTVTAGGGPWMLMGGTQTMKLNASDYVEVKAGVSMHWDYGSAAWSNFSGHLVG
jgi:hypothetical protein